MGLAVKQWRDEFGSGTQYEAPSEAPEDNTPLDAAGLRDLETRVDAAIDTEETARLAGDAALDARLDAIEGLGSLATDAELSAAVVLRQATAAKGQANGYAGLDVDARVPLAQVPAVLQTIAGLSRSLYRVLQNVDGTWPDRPTIGGQPVPWAVMWVSQAGNVVSPVAKMDAAYDSYFPVPAP